MSFTSFTRLINQLVSYTLSTVTFTVVSRLRIELRAVAKVAKRNHDVLMDLVPLLAWAVWHDKWTGDGQVTVGFCGRIRCKGLLLVGFQEIAH